MKGVFSPPIWGKTLRKKYEARELQVVWLDTGGVILQYEGSKGERSDGFSSYAGYGEIVKV
jgi:hypothetical protein